METIEPGHCAITPLSMTWNYRFDPIHLIFAPGTDDQRPKYLPPERQAPGFFNPTGNGEFRMRYN